MIIFYYLCRGGCFAFICEHDKSTRKQKHYLQGNAIPVGYNAHMLLYVSEVNYNLNSDAAERKLQYRCTTTVPRVYNRPQRYSGNFTSCATWCTQTCSFRAIFWTTCMKLLTASRMWPCCQCYNSDVRKKNYTDAHLHYGGGF